MLKQHRSLKYSMRLFTCRSFTTRERFRHANKKISTCKQNGQNSIMHNLIYAGYGRWIEATLPKNQSKKLKMHDTHISFPGAWRVVVIAQKHPTFRHAQIKMVRTAFQKLGIKGQVRRGGDEERHYLRGAKEITGPGKVDHSGREFANFLWRTPRGKKYMRQGISNVFCR